MAASHPDWRPLMPGYNLLDYSLQYIVIALNMALLVLLLKGRHYFEFRWFTLYIGFAVCKSLTLVMVNAKFSPATYFFVYYFGLIVAMIFIGLAALESIAEVFAPYKTIPLPAVINLIGATVLVTIVALAVSVSFGYHPNVKYWDAILTADKFSRFVIFGGLTVAVYIANRVRLPWNPRTTGVCAGLMFFTIFQALNSIQTVPGVHENFSRPFGMVSYIIAQLVWLYTFRRGWVPPPPLTQERVAEMKQKSAGIRERLELLTSISN